MGGPGTHDLTEVSLSSSTNKCMSVEAAVTVSNAKSDEQLFTAYVIRCSPGAMP